jgi:hypothetical protein
LRAFGSADSVAVGAIGFTYTFVREVSANLREEDDWYNSMLGGFLAGGLVGAYSNNWPQRRSGIYVLMKIDWTGRSIPGIIGLGVMSGVATSILTYTGGSLQAHHDPNRDIYAEREALRKRYRVPADQTIAELGEGRGMLLLSQGCNAFTHSCN